MACRLASMLKQREMKNKQQIEENKVFFRIFAAELRREVVQVIVL